MGLTVYESHDDDFAKIVRTPSGRQVLAFCEANDEGKPAVTLVVVVEGVTMKMGVGFEDDDSGYDKRDAYFESFDEAKAQDMESAAIKAIA